MGLSSQENKSMDEMFILCYGKNNIIDEKENYIRAKSYAKS